MQESSPFWYHCGTGFVSVNVVEYRLVAAQQLTTMEKQMAAPTGGDAIAFLISVDNQGFARIHWVFLMFGMV